MDLETPTVARPEVVEERFASLGVPSSCSSLLEKAGVGETEGSNFLLHFYVCQEEHLLR